MAVDDYSGLVEGFEMLGEFVRGVIESPDAMYFIVLLLLLLMMVSIVKRLLGKIPFFEGDGDLPVNTQGNIVAWCLSLLAILALGWSMRNQGPEAVVRTILGPYGFWATILVTVLAGYAIYANTEQAAYRATRWCFTLLGSSVVFGWMTGLINESSTFILWPALAVFVIATGLAMAVNYGMRNE